MALWNRINVSGHLRAFSFIKCKKLHINGYRIYLAIKCCHQNHDMDKIIQKFPRQ
jgi:hypothetical protein